MNRQSCPEIGIYSSAIRFRAIAAIIFLLCLLLLPAHLAVAQTGTVTIADIGDFGLASQSEADVANLVKSWNPDYIITNGDNNYPSGAASTIDANIGQYYHAYMYPYSGKYGAGATSNRFFPCIGNHDWGDKYPNPTGLKPYLAYLTLPNNERYYDFVVGPVHFFSLDSDQNEPDGTSSTSVQATWLKNKLAAAKEQWKIVYFHHGPYTSTAYATTYMRWPFQAWGATAVLAGHLHNYERLSVNGLPYIVNGLGGEDEILPFTTVDPNSVIRYDSDFGATRITASSSKLTFDFITRTGLLVDTLTLNASVPSSLTATPGNTQIGLAWTAAPGATSYNVKRSTTSGGPYTKIASAVTGTSYIDTGLTNGTTYYYVVTANTSSGESANSNEAFAAPSVTGLRINAGGDAYSGTLGAFLADTDFVGGGLWSYTTRSIANTSDPALYLDVRTADTSFGYNLPVANGTYNLRLHFAECTMTGTGQRLMNITVNGSQVLTNFDIFAAAGGANRAVIETIPVTVTNGVVNLTVASVLTTSSPVLAAIEVIPNTGGGSAPPAPTGLTGTPAGLSAQLSWQPSSGAASYSVKRGTTSGGPYSTVATGITTTSYTNTGLTAGTTYYYVVTATNSSGESGSSNQVSVVPLSSLAAPSNLTATAGNKQVSLAWSAVSGATGYSVLRSTVSGGPYTNVASGVATVAYTDTGLTNGTTYYYVVVATNASSQSPNSSQVSAVPNGTTLRINCGGSAYNGTLGSFVADTDVTGGYVWSYSTRTISGTSDPALYLAVRASDTNFSYSIPAVNGSYTLRLHFAECTYTAAKQRLMNVTVNGTQTLSNFDIFATGGANASVIKSSTVNVTNGTIAITVASTLTSSGAVLAAIEVIPN